MQNRIKNIDLKIFAQRMETILRGANQRELAETIGISQPSISRYKKGERIPDGDILYKLSQFSGKSIEWILGIEQESSGNLLDTFNKRAIQTFLLPTHSIPILTQCPAGKPKAWFAEDRLEGLPDVYDVIPRSQYIFGLRVEGDSMFPFVYPGDVVIVDPEREANSGDMVIARIGEEDHTLKYMRRTGKTVTLISENPSYEPMVHPIENVEILGRVVAVVRDNTNGRRGQYTMDVVEVLKDAQVFGLSLKLAEMPEEFLEAMNTALATRPPEPDRKDIYRWSNWMQRIYRRAVEEIEKILQI